MDLAGTAVDADLAKRLYRTERLRHASKREYEGLAARESTSMFGLLLASSLRIHLLEQAQRIRDVADASCG